MFPMVWGSPLRFSHASNFSWVKCFKSPSVVGSDSMDLQKPLKQHISSWDKSNIDNEEMFPMV